MDESFESAERTDLYRARRQRAASADNNGNGSIERLPPHSIEAEQGVLGCCLLSPKDTLPIAIAKFNASDDAFYDLRHQTIFANLMQMAANAVAGIDIVTLHQRLKDFGLLDQVGGMEYLNTLADMVPSAANLTYYIDIVIQKFLLRKAIATCAGVVGQIYANEQDGSKVLDEMERDVLNVRRSVVSSESYSIKELVHGSIDRFEQAFQTQGHGVLTGIATGFIDFDKMTGGLQAGDMIVIAARPSMGKTSLAMNIADYVAVTGQIPVGVFSLEMTKESLSDRMLSSRARVNLRNIREGFLSEIDFPKLTSAAGQLSKSPLRIDDTPSLSIMAVRARARSMWQQYGIKLFVIDYLQLMHSTTKRAEQNRQNEVTDISGGIKALAKELGVPVVVLSQLNRNSAREKGRRPRLDDLRESGSIEQDADVVGMLYAPAQDEEESLGVEEPDGLAINLLIAKQRNGPTGDVALTFLKPYTRFESAAKVSDYDVPAE